MTLATDRPPIPLEADGDLLEVARRAARALGAEVGPVREVHRTFLDTFDWRLWRAGELLIEEPDGGGVRLQLIRGAKLRRTLRAQVRPRFARELPWGVEIAGRLGLRALLPQVTVRGRAAAVGAGELAALEVEGRALPVRIVVPPGADAERLAAAGFRAAGPLLEAALVAVGRRPGDYDRRIAVPVAVGEPAHLAARRVLARILEVVVANEAGVRDDVDPEFLHDLRVALRKTRSVLGAAQQVLPDGAPLTEELRWLGRVTGPLRDDDVFLQVLARLEGDFGDLGAVRRRVLERRATARGEVTAVLAGERYRELIAGWSALLAGDGVGPRGGAPIQAVVTPRIRKLARRLVREVGRIDAQAPDEALHEVRKRAKKLRYLVELFAPLYPGDRAGAGVRALKALQAELGAVQDLAVQAARLRGAPEAGAVVERLERRKAALRAALLAQPHAERLRAALEPL